MVFFFARLAKLRIQRVDPYCCTHRCRTQWICNLFCVKTLMHSLHLYTFVYEYSVCRCDHFWFLNAHWLTNATTATISMKLFRGCAQRCHTHRTNDVCISFSPPVCLGIEINNNWWILSSQSRSTGYIINRNLHSNRFRPNDRCYIFVQFDRISNQFC